MNYFYPFKNKLIELVGVLPVDLVVFSFIAFVAVLFVASLVILIFSRSSRSRSKRFFLRICDFVTLFLLSYLLLLEEVSFSFAFAFTAIYAAVVRILYFILTLFYSKPKSEEKKKQEPPIKREVVAREVPIRPIEERKTALSDSDVTLSHVFEIVESLRSIDLSDSDRAELERMNTMLGIYKNKQLLSAQEIRTLNEYLSALLKMMTKYNV